MKRSKLDQAATSVNDAFRELLCEKFQEEFGREITAEWNIFAGPFGALISRPKDGGKYTPAQKRWVMGFDAGYMAASGHIGWLANEQAMRKA